MLHCADSFCHAILCIRATRELGPAVAERLICIGGPNIAVADSPQPSIRTATNGFRCIAMAFGTTAAAQKMGVSGNFITATAITTINRARLVACKAGIDAIGFTPALGCRSTRRRGLGRKKFAVTENI